MLGQVDECGAARIGDLAQVRRLEATGLLTRVPDPADGRATLVSLTGHGERKLEALRVARTAAVASLLDRLGAADCARLRVAVETLPNLLDAAAACDSES